MQRSNLILISIILASCRGNSNLEEVMIPDPEITTEVIVGKPDDVVAKKGNFELTKLDFNYQDYSPFLDAKSLELHYSKHYLKVTNQLNVLVKESPFENLKIETLFKKLKYKDLAIQNKAVDYYNHSLFFSILTKENYDSPEGELMDQITIDFGSYTALKSEFTTVARANESGWVWLIQNKKGELKIVHSTNYTNPLVPNFKPKGEPLLVLDLNEHAYFLKYNFNKNDYIFNFFKAINWKKIEQHYRDNSATGQ